MPKLEFLALPAIQPSGKTTFGYFEVVALE